MSAVYTAGLPTGHSDISRLGSTVRLGVQDADLVPVQSGEDWIARLDDDLSRPVGSSGDSFRISALQREDPVCVTLHDWVLAEELSMLGGEKHASGAAVALASPE